MSAKLEKQIRDIIASELKKVTIKNAPKTYTLIQTNEGYKKMEEKILTMILEFDFTPGSCIPQIEATL